MGNRRRYTIMFSTMAQVCVQLNLYMYCNVFHNWKCIFIIAFKQITDETGNRRPVILAPDPEFSRTKPSAQSVKEASTSKTDTTTETGAVHAGILKKNRIMIRTAPDLKLWP